MLNAYFNTNPRVKGLPQPEIEPQSPGPRTSCHSHEL